MRAVGLSSMYPGLKARHEIVRSFISALRPWLVRGSSFPLTFRPP
jgi:hypothetical protein